MAEEYVFRFLSVRPVDVRRKIERANQKVPLQPGAAPTPFQRELERAKIAADPVAATAAAVARFRSSDAYVADLATLPIELRAALDWMQTHGDAKADSAETRDAMESLLGQPLALLAQSQAFEQSRLRLADTLVAEAHTATPEGLNPDRTAAAHKLLALVAGLASGGAATAGTGATVGEAVGARTILMPPLPVGAPAPIPVPPEPQVAPAGKAADESGKNLAALEVAHSELIDAAMRPEALDQERRPVAAGGTGDTGGKHRSFFSFFRAAPADINLATLNASRPSLTSAAVASLSEGTRQVLSDLRLDLAKIDPIGTVSRLERNIANAAADAEGTEEPRSMLLFGSGSIDIAAVIKSLRTTSPKPSPPPAPRCTFQAGIGDLLIVRQRLKGYELAEIAATENVLAGEKRSREHRRLDTSEETFISTATTETEKEKDLQSTQRNEMQTEADKTIQQQFGLEAGVQVSGSYGPSVQFAAHLNTTFSTTTQETQKKAVAFSQEVTQKTSERIRHQVSQTVSRRVVREIQEVNLHSFTNESTDRHIRGIYRWLNKVYDAQVYNYGQRMMYEFVVPEPAAFFLHATVESPPVDRTIIKPAEPRFNGAPLRPSHLTRGNYQSYVAAYRVSAVPSPPPEYLTVAFFDKQDGSNDTANYARANKIAIPDGYEAYGAHVMTDYIFKEGRHSFRVMLGGTRLDLSNVWGVAYSEIGPIAGELAVAFDLLNVVAFTLGIEVRCRLTASATAKWQQQAYDSIIEAYQRQRAEYDDRLARHALELESSQAVGRNPAENLRATREELKKLVVAILTRSNDVSRDSFWPGSDQQMRLDRVCANGAWIRFFENAFEWTNLTYVLYPYFWGRRARWISAIQMSDADSEFAAFLRAGAARIQLPVRPGFEKAVAHFCQFGEIWEGNDPPLRDDDHYIPIVDEIAANLGRFEGDGVPYPEGAEPWEVRIPTELVLVQNLQEVPAIRDMMTGGVVTVDA